MKYFQVLLLGILAERSLAGEYKCNQKVDITLLGKTYLEGAECTLVPTGGNDILTTNFKEAFINSTITYGQSLMNLSYTWGLERGQELIDAVKKRSCALETCIKSFDDTNETPACLEYALEDLTKQFHVFLELIPGNALIKRKPLPDLPPQPEKIIPISTLSAPDIFLNLAEAFNQYLQTFYNLVVTIHLQGWRDIRGYFNIVQKQFRNQILNDWVLMEYRKIVDKVLEFATYIQCHVKPELWESFRNACDRIIAISDDYTASKLRDGC